MRTLIAATAALLASIVPTSPATAANVDVITGTITIDCFACGYTTGSADLLVNGTYPASVSFNSIYQDPDQCAWRGFMYGTISGYYNGPVYMEHDGHALYVNIESAPGGTGGGTFVFEGLPCGASNVTADIAAAVAGA